MVDSDKKTLEYFKEHIEKKGTQLFHKPFEQHINHDLKNIFELIENANTNKTEENS